MGGKNVKGSRQCEGGVKARSNKSQGKVKVRSRQRKHNLDLNYNLMGFDIIEIYLVFLFSYLKIKLGIHKYDKIYDDKI